MSAPVVSVIMANFNGERYISDAITSVRDQTVENWELLIADDCSTDASTRLVESWAARDKRVQLLRSMERGGPAQARNMAIAASTGRFVAFLDSDDQWTAQKLEKQVKLLRDTNCAMAFTAYRKMDEMGTLDPRVIFPRTVVHYRDMLSRNYLACSSVMIDREIVGSFAMPDIVRRQDYATWLHLMREHGVQAYGLEEPLLHYRVYADSFSAQKLVSAHYHWRVLRECERLSFAAAVPHFLTYALGAGGEYFHGKLRTSLIRRYGPKR